MKTIIEITKQQILDYFKNEFNVLDHFDCQEETETKDLLIELENDTCYDIEMVGHFEFEEEYVTSHNGMSLYEKAIDSMTFEIKKLSYYNELNEEFVVNQETINELEFIINI